MVGMTGFDETQHPRQAGGQFAVKQNDAPAGDLPAAPGEVLVWLIEGDDHEFVKVEAATEEEALDLAADSFEDRYGDRDDEDEDRTPVRDLLIVAGTFRGDVDGYSDELEFVPYGDIDEIAAVRKLENA